MPDKEQTPAGMPDLTAKDIAPVLDRLQAVKICIEDIKAGTFNGYGLDAEMEAINRQLNALKEAPGADLAAIAEAAEQAAAVAHEVQEAIDGLKITGIADIEAIIPEIAALVPEIPATAFEPLTKFDAHMVKAINDITGDNSAIKALARMMQDVSKWAQEASQRIKKAAETIANFMQSDKVDTMNRLFTGFTEWVTQYEDNDTFDVIALADFIEHYNDLLPIVEQELDRLRQEKGVEAITFEEFLAEPIDESTGEPSKSLFEICIERAYKNRLNEALQGKPEGESGEFEQMQLQLFAEDMPKLQSIMPKYHIMPNSYLMNYLAGVKGKKPINAGEQDLPVINEDKRQREITIFVMASLETENGIISSLTEYERNVSDAIMSIWEQAQRDGVTPAFTADSLYRAMPGSGERASAQQKGAITKAVEKLRHLYLDVDATLELRQRGIIGEKDTYTINENYLTLRRHDYGRYGERKQTAWEIKVIPPILDYSKRIKQILTVPAKYLAIEKVKQGKASGEILMMNADRQAMTSYMLRRIAIMKHDRERAADALRSYNRRRSRDKTLPEKTVAAFRRQSDTILFDTLFEETATSTDNRKMTMNNRNFCFDVLDYWKTTGYIKGYEKQTKGRSITGVTIVY